ncbi:MAG: DinB family protein [Planctomycetota bacterium]
MPSHYAFLVDTYATEILKVLSVWAMASDVDLDVRPRPDDRRGRTLREHMVHQCQSENGWFAGMLGIVAPGEVLPADATRTGFLEHYAAAARHRLQALTAQDDAWWQQEVAFFEVQRSRAWVMTRRIAHTAHHRGQQTVLLRLCGRALHSTYGPTADTGGLPRDQAPILYAYQDIDALLAGEQAGGAKRGLPERVARAVTELA